MKTFAVIGNPIDHSISPLMHNWIFQKLNIKAQYNKIKVYNNNLFNIIEQLKEDALCGINVTIPYKEKIEINLLKKLKIGRLSTQQDYYKI